MRRRLVRVGVLSALGGMVTAIIAAHLSAPNVVAASTAANSGQAATRGVRVADVVSAHALADWAPVDHPPRLVSVTVASLPPTPDPTPAPAVQPPASASQHSVTAAAPSAGRPAPPPPAAAPSPAQAPAGVVSQVIALVNQDRAAAGLPALSVSAGLDRAAAVHAGQNASADQMSHDGVVQDVDAQGVSWHTLGECLGWVSGSPSPSYINQMWMQSSEHRSLILGSFTTVGAGWAESATGTWYVSLIEIT
jgi:uncharacterized protein YkwD